MASYRVEISQSAERQLKKLPSTDRRRMVVAIQALADHPFPKGARKLSGYEDVFRIRVGFYRVLYSVTPTKLVVIILKVGHRKEIYR